MDNTCTSFISGLLPSEDQCQVIFQWVQFYNTEFLKSNSFCSVLRSLKYIANITKDSQALEKPRVCQKCWHEWCRAWVSKCWNITISKPTHQNRINDKMPKEKFPVKILEYFSVAAVQSVGTTSGNLFLKWHTDQKHLQCP